eukprot:CAMPEP_0170567688 /NCGR_PEP_ID=MMETSP0211-20121228/80641_1 /TAXON_ID=311385 /ORGANISM="Pseudokeronopsis sp., Strain OXSARD2" /LENGTH=84 /DNA_ID=CAMNT_0010889221 /DNA_START=1554 /DNA_END=1809 /DNA_ORIENTATION=+
METSGNILRLEQRIKELEGDKEKLIRDNITLIKDNDYLKDQINYTIKDEKKETSRPLWTRKANTKKSKDYLSQMSEQWKNDAVS